MLFIVRLMVVGSCMDGDILTVIIIVLSI